MIASCLKAPARQNSTKMGTGASGSTLAPRTPFRMLSSWQTLGKDLGPYTWMFYASRFLKRSVLLSEE